MHEAGTANVNVGNFPAAPHTVIIQSGNVTPDGNGNYVVAGSGIATPVPVDTSAYRSVTLYMAIDGQPANSQLCQSNTIFGNGFAFPLDSGFGTAFAKSQEAAYGDVLAIRPKESRRKFPP